MAEDGPPPAIAATQDHHPGGWSWSDLVREVLCDEHALRTWQAHLVRRAWWPEQLSPVAPPTPTEGGHGSSGPAPGSAGPGNGFHHAQGRGVHNQAQQDPQGDESAAPLAQQTNPVEHRCDDDVATDRVPFPPVSSEAKTRGEEKGDPLYLKLCFTVLLVADVVLRSISQVYVVDNPISAVLMLIGVGLSSPWYVLYSVCGSLCGNLGSLYVLRHLGESSLIGLYGYDSTLVANAAFTFVADGATAKVFFITMGACFFAGMARCSVGLVLTHAKLPTLTITFCSVTAFYLNCVGRNFAGLRLANSPLPPLDTIVDGGFYWDSAFRGIGQVIFADTGVGGGLVWLAILLYSRHGACYTLAGSFIGTVFGLYVNDSVASVAAVRYGLQSYNPSLTALALGIQVFLKFKTFLDYLLPLFGAFFVVVGQLAYISVLGGAPYHTFPFVLTLYLILPAILHPPTAPPAASPPPSATGKKKD